MKGLLMLSISLAIGYGLCVVARKEKGYMKTLGYALGIGVIAVSLLYGAVESILNCPMKGKFMCDKKMASHYCPDFMKGIRK